VKGGGETTGLAALWLIRTLCHTFCGILFVLPEIVANQDHFRIAGYPLVSVLSWMDNLP